MRAVVLAATPTPSVVLAVSEIAYSVSGSKFLIKKVFLMPDRRRVMGRKDLPFEYSRMYSKTRLAFDSSSSGISQATWIWSWFTGIAWTFRGREGTETKAQHSNESLKGRSTDSVRR